MADWQKLLHERGIATLKQLVEKFGPDHFPDLARLQEAVDNFEFRISPAMVDLIKEPGDPIWRQYVPDLQELEVVDGVLDSLDEEGDSPVPNITHRYPDRALFLVSPVCAAYCRFCTRRRKVGDPEKIPMSRLESAFKYLEEHTEIRDVILSGGDPLLLSDRRLDQILGRLRKINHIEVVRIGSRVPCHLPERITPELCATLKKHHPLYINTHFNHPAELTPAAVAGLGRLADAGIPLGCQTVLLRGVNDDVAVMKQLMQKLLAARVRPYYIFMCDNVAGVEHFKTNVMKGLEIVRGLRGWTSGLAVPHFVIDAPGGGGKVPLLPEYVERITEDEVVMRNYEGDRYVYRQPRQEVLVGASSAEQGFDVVALFEARAASKSGGNGRRQSAARGGGRRTAKGKRS